MWILNWTREMFLESWHILLESAPWVLVGLFMAGMVKAFVPERTVAGHLGGKGWRAVVKASILGVPLPLCSCSVVPTAVALRRQGASRGATTAFMISTPESGVDSVAVTWALLDPVMTVVRPLAAVATATFAGLLVEAGPFRESAGDAPMPGGT